MNWNHILVKDGENLDEIDQAIKVAKTSEQPTIIEVKTIIGKGSLKEGTSDIHGNPLGQDDTNNLRKTLKWEYKEFEVPKEVYDFYTKEVYNRGQNVFKQWNEKLLEFKRNDHKDFELFERFIKGEINFSAMDNINYPSDSKEATRNISGKILAALSKDNLNIIGGSADLTASTKAKGADGNFLPSNYLGRNINFGVREHAMGAIANGITLHGGLKTFVGGFFVFSDYMKPAIRLSALMNIPTTYIFTHDSIGVGEDGPTHQPIEQLTGLRSIPNLNVFRPADANETKAAYIQAFSKQYPTAMILTRQNVVNSDKTSITDAQKGGYIVSHESKKLDGIIISCGSELNLAIEVQTKLLEKNIDTRVVSMPSMFLFDQQSKEHKNKVLPNGIKTLAIEMGSSMPWFKYADFVYGIDEFGISAPLNQALDHFGFNAEKIVEYYLKSK